MACLPRPVMIIIWSHPEASASSTPYWMMGLSTSGSISLGWALVAGRKRVPSPAAGKTALRTLMAIGIDGQRAEISAAGTRLKIVPDCGCDWLRPRQHLENAETAEDGRRVRGGQSMTAGK